MATAHQAGGDQYFETLRRLAPKLLVVVALACALAVSGCAGSAQRLSGTSRFDASGPRYHSTKSRVHTAAYRRAPARIRTAAPRRVHAARPVAPRPVALPPAPRFQPIEQSMLAPQPAPDCDYKEPEAATADPTVWARLKLDYERQCYRKAEAAARERLEQMQTSLRKCGDRPACATGPSERGSPDRR
jgi:hypothetical protein